VPLPYSYGRIVTHGVVSKVWSFYYGSKEKIKGAQRPTIDCTIIFTDTASFTVKTNEASSAIRREEPLAIFHFVFTMTEPGQELEAEGSWLPFLIFCIVGFILWISFGQGGTPVRMRRWYNMQV
jgi:hypothetical protein